MRLKADKKLRDAWFVKGAMSHPAKGHLGLWWEILERYTQPGQWVLDPMAGIGSTLMGAMMGRNVVCVELEPHFITPMRASWLKMRQQAMLGSTMGQVVILRGDARCLPLAGADCVVTSPPYEGTIQNGETPDMAKVAAREARARLKHPERPEWVGYTRPDAIVTSPPYEGSIQGEPGIDFTKMEGGKRDMTKEAAQATRLASLSGYTRPDAIVTSPPYEGAVHGDSGIDRSKEARVSGPNSQTGDRQGYKPVDAVVTSPPYEGTRADGSELQERIHAQGGFHAYTNEESYRWHTERDQTNIGNLRGEKYWEAMRLVYGECHRVLAQNGLLCLIVKGYTRDGQYVDLPQQTVDCCLALGFRLRERWERELWSLSFWRILQRRRDPAAFDDRLRFEPILVLEKAP